MICEAARQGARQAVVHGKLAPSPWSPASGAYPGQNPYTVTADSSSDAIASAVRPYLATVGPSTVTIKVRYHDFTTITRSHSAPPTRDEDDLTARAVRLLDKTEAGRIPIRLLGVSVHNFCGQDDPVDPDRLPFDEHDD